MIDRFIATCCQRRGIVWLVLLFVTAYGIYSWKQLPIEAYPDIADITSQIVTQVPGLGAEAGRQLSDGLAAGAGLRALEVVPERLRPALATVAREASAAGMHSALTAAALAATTATLLVALLIRTGSRQTNRTEPVD